MTASCSSLKIHDSGPQPSQMSRAEWGDRVIRVPLPARLLLCLSQSSRWWENSTSNAA
jgi:hypothetical protein